ncbi:uncharacterized [Lates japonicus]
MGGERGGEERRGTVTVLSPVTHTDVRGGGEEQEEDRGENRGAGKVKETTSEEDAKKRRKASNTERKDQEIELRTKDGQSVLAKWNSHREAPSVIKGASQGRKTWLEFLQACKTRY